MLRQTSSTRVVFYVSDRSLPRGVTITSRYYSKRANHASSVYRRPKTSSVFQWFFS